MILPAVYILNSNFSSKLLNYGIREQIDDFVPTLMISFLAAGSGYILAKNVGWHPAFLVIVCSVFMVLILFALNLLLNRKCY